jgi:hypothetical protein
MADAENGEQAPEAPQPQVEDAQPAPAENGAAEPVAAAEPNNEQPKEPSDEELKKALHELLATADLATTSGQSSAILLSLMLPLMCQALSALFTYSSISKGGSPTSPATLPQLQRRHSGKSFRSSSTVTSHPRRHSSAARYEGM